MTNRQLYRFLLLEQRCAIYRNKCDKDCVNCKCYVNVNDANYMFNQLIGIIKSREPELYFLDNLAELSKLLVPEEDTTSESSNDI